MFAKLIKMIFGSQAERELKKMSPVVDEINRIFEELDTVPDETISGKVWEFRARLQQGEELDDILPEAFAVVKQACKRQVGKEWIAARIPIKWVEVPYNVQIIGGIALHRGMIAEMATGEGKTLVAIMPLYLNAIEGKGAHLATFNDFLAQRDAEWMRPLFEFLGMTVGCILQDMDPADRRKQYACDITYGQSSEFGFDYLRDNMTTSSQGLVQGARSLVSQEIADQVIAQATQGEQGRVVADRFQTLIVEVPPALAPEIIREHGAKFSVDRLRVYWNSDRSQAKMPQLPDHTPEIEEVTSDPETPQGVARVRFDFVSRDHHYAIVDESDSLLIDEARTPLIISGQVDRSTHQFDKMRPLVENLAKRQATLVNQFLSQAEELLEAGDDDSRYQAGMRLLQAKKANPKNKRLLKYQSDPTSGRLINRAENDFIIDQKSKMGEKSLKWVEEELLYVIDEKGHSVDLTEKGRETVSPDDPDRFLLADLVDEFSRIEGDEALSEADREKRKEELRRQNDMKSEELHNISQLLRAYSLFEKDVDYVVEDNRVIIVDEFTGRPQPGRRYSDGLHQAIEAKERVKIEKESQTLATITIQNYFRMYDKLAGMTGTAETEAAEFSHTYKTEVMVIPTNLPIIRNDMNDVIYRTRREKYNAVVEEIGELHAKKLPILVGTVSVEASELLSRMLKRAGISHSVLNAKYHQKEAEIVRDAGQPGAVTIATNMAGRGTDIKLGPGVIRRDENGKLDPEEPGGLQIIGTERHEARRIDRQLRGRAGRQGDPGASRFFLSLEDDLMRLFGSERISGILQRLGLEEGEPIEHPFITRAITRAQRRIEEINFERRKRTLEYDNVMNKQRETIYGLRREVLVSEDLRNLILDICFDALSAHIETFRNEEATADQPAYDLDAFENYIRTVVAAVDLEGIERPAEPDETYLSAIVDKITEAYDLKAQLLGLELCLELARYIVLSVIDQEWRDHLHGIDELREGIHLRSYAQLDPLIEYQREATHMFQEMMGTIQRMAFEHFFRANVVAENQSQAASVDYGRGAMEDVSNYTEGDGQPQEMATSGAGREGGEPRRPRTFTREQPKVGRNDPCPCGSGKKYKKCCGQ